MSDNPPAPPSLANWQALPDVAIARLVRQRGASTALCLDSTRRWYHFDYLAGRDAPAGPEGYITAAAQALAELLILLTAHGLDPLFLPLQLPLSRGVGYSKMSLGAALPALLHHPQLAALARHARIRPYGPWPALPAGHEAAAPAYTALQAEVSTLAARTAANKGPRLFWIVQFNPDPADPPSGVHPQAELLEIAGTLQTHLGRPPQHEELLTAYYHLDPGEALAPIRLLLSAQLEYPVGLTMPPLLGGYEDLYFTAASLLSLDRHQLRAILYDWLFLRPHPAEDYETLAPAERTALAAWYQHRRQVLGLGARHPHGDFWYPLL
jgi:hypothetical protein